MSNKHFFEGVEKSEYDLSVDEPLMIKECDELIGRSNHS
jgi:hypothetical protein